MNDKPSAFGTGPDTNHIWKKTIETSLSAHLPPTELKQILSILSHSTDTEYKVAGNAVLSDASTAGL